MTETKNENNKHKSTTNVGLIETINKASKQPSHTIETLELKEGMDVVLESWTFRKIIRGIKKGKIIVDHDFQRDEVYRVPQKSGIINSAMLGKSIPPLYAFEDRDENGKIRLSIIDGQQRLSSVRDFMNNKFELVIPYGELNILNGYTYEQIKQINPELGEQIGDLTLDFNVIRNINKNQAQEYFGLINTTSMPLSPGERLWSIHDPVKTILKGIVENPYFKIANLRKTRKREYVVASKLLWNQMFMDSQKHEFITDRIKEFIDYFNSVEDVEFLEVAQHKVLKLLKTYSEIVENCQYSPRSQGDLYSVLCFIDVLSKNNNINKIELSKFINWVFKGINKQIYPLRLQDQFEQLSHKRVGKNHVSSREFVIMMEYLYKEERDLWFQ